MKRLPLLLLLLPVYFFGQTLDSLTVEKIMRDPKWIGTSPTNVFWSPDSKQIYFNWNPDQVDSDSLYTISLNNRTPRKVKQQDQKMARAQQRGAWNADYTKKVFVKEHMLYLLDVKTDELTPLFQTSDEINHPEFGLDDAFIVFQLNKDLYKRDLNTGALRQITNFKEGEEEKEKELSDQDKFLEEDALKNSEILRERKEKRKKAEKNKLEGKSIPKPIFLGDKKLSFATLSPNGEKVIYQVIKESEVRYTMVPDYVSQSGYTDPMSARPKVGVDHRETKTYIYNKEKDTTYALNIEDIPGIRDIPEFYKNYPGEQKKLEEEKSLRKTYISKPIWNDAGDKAFVVIRALDNKDRWIMSLDADTGELSLLDRQHDDAWIGGPGIGYPGDPGNVGWIDDNTLYFHSEKTGYSHLYTVNVKRGKEKALTKGKYEIQNAKLSENHKTFYITANQDRPGETNFYNLDIKSGKQTQITQEAGGNSVEVSPDGRHLVNLFSTSNHPAELFLQENKAGAEPEQITDKAETEEFKSYTWRKPEIFTFKNRDGDEVYAEVYKPKKQAKSKPGAVFVHGAGYLQDVKNSWSDPYFREHMFMNLLADHGYTVLNIDYRGSAGYGRDWRTAIYRHMGKNDLADIVDGAKYMTEEFDVNSDNIGLWGGSYGGFMTLMAMFKTDVFTAGGALRSVTDWAHYNHGYTANILNTPENDSIAYEQSSPINFAEDFNHGHLLMAHGMVDTNVHFQDIVRLNQKLIELGKDNWYLAVYPVESHAFTEPSSWTDEYKRIYNLFEENLK